MVAVSADAGVDVPGGGENTRSWRHREIAAAFAPLDVTVAFGQADDFERLARYWETGLRAFDRAIGETLAEAWSGVGASAAAAAISTYLTQARELAVVLDELPGIVRAAAEAIVSAKYAIPQMSEVSGGPVWSADEMSTHSAISAAQEDAQVAMHQRYVVPFGALYGQIPVIPIPSPFFGPDSDSTDHRHLTETAGVEGTAGMAHGWPLSAAVAEMVEVPSPAQTAFDRVSGDGTALVASEVPVAGAERGEQSGFGAGAGEKGRDPDLDERMGSEMDAADDSSSRLGADEERDAANPNGSASEARSVAGDSVSAPEELGVDTSRPGTNGPDTSDPTEPSPTEPSPTEPSPNEPGTTELNGSETDSAGPEPTGPSTSEHGMTGPLAEKQVVATGEAVRSAADGVAVTNPAFSALSNSGPLTPPLSGAAMPPSVVMPAVEPAVAPSIGDDGRRHAGAPEPSAIGAGRPTSPGSHPEPFVRPGPREPAVGASVPGTANPMATSVATASQPVRPNDRHFPCAMGPAAPRSADADSEHELPAYLITRENTDALLGRPLPAITGGAIGGDRPGEQHVPATRC
ncbi:hypothetical protein ACFO5K_00260 [Nocardia halotolerans]|uniref:PPE family protein n=1 Tax=Nocardia halotolerans TaxID=1755878 RepID=A0ABV8VBB0_9NOCA